MRTNLATRPKVAILGGTFDPIHNGHLRIALELKQQLGLDEIRLMPCHRPPHRTEPGLDSHQRAGLIRLAIARCPDLQLDERELHRDKASYTLDTLIDLRAELGDDVSLIWALGVDAFLGINTWYRWQALLDYAHLAVVGRPGFQLPGDGDTGDVAQLLREKQAPREILDQRSRGAIVLPSLSLLAISATDIRTQIARGESPQFLVPDSVWQEIARENFYR